VPLNPATLTDALAALDAYEGVIAGMPNASEYTRTPVTAYTNDGRNHQAWIWIASHTTIRDLNLGPATLIRSGRWAAAPQKETL
jgi:hypothetical protein